MHDTKCSGTEQNVLVRAPNVLACNIPPSELHSSFPYSGCYMVRGMREGTVDLLIIKINFNQSVRSSNHLRLLFSNCFSHVFNKTVKRQKFEVLEIEI